MPFTSPHIDAATRRCRQIIKRRALVSAAAAFVPIPAIDLAVDLGTLISMLDEINTEFGLSPAQIELLAPQRRLSAYQAIAALGSSTIGRIVSREVLTVALKRVAGRVAAKSVLRFVPLAGQAVAAAISYGAIKFIGDRHLADCVAVAEQLAPPRRRPG